MMTSRFQVIFSTLIVSLISVSAFSSTYRYIAIDSGGMLGLIPATVIKGIEEETGKPIHQLVNGFMGTSTGAIVSSLVSVPAPNSDQPYSAAEIVDFYKNRGALVFKNAPGKAITNMLSQKKDYSLSKVLKNELDKTFEERRLADAKADLIILSYNQVTGKIHRFDSQSSDISVTNAVLASSSVDLVFGPLMLDIGGESQTFIDAGSSSVRGSISDPTPELVNLIEQRMNPEDICVIYSIGTGFAKARKMTNLPSNIRVVRLEPDVNELSKAYFTKDLLASDTNPTTLAAMIEVGEALKSSPEYKQMVVDLSGSLNADL